jgi:putative ABC transport system permease protein
MNAAPNFWSEMAVGESLAFAYDALSADKARTALTGLGMIIGTAALILVVTIGMTGKQYVLKQIDAIGTNWIFAEYEGGAQRITNVTPDPLRIDDMTAVLREVPGIVAASPVVSLQERLPIGRGRERDLQVLGVYPDYERVRNLIILSGRFFDPEDLRARNKVGVITEKLADQLYGPMASAVGKVIRLSGLPFTVIGTFKERVDTFGQSEITTDTMVVPYTVSRFFVQDDSVKQLYFSATDSAMVVPATAQIRRVIQGRHRPESVYLVNNLTRLIALADRTALALTIVLLLVAMVTLLVSGIGIMNIMLATVSSRTHEIGVRKSVGATRRAIGLQFLAEALLISLAGGTIGAVIGLGLPFSVRFLTDYRVPISGLSVIVALGACSLVGILFGTVPAVRAAQLDPIESLRYE